MKRNHFPDRTLGLPDSDACRARLHQAGWTVGEAAFGSTWLVSGTNEENLVRAEARTQAEAWNHVCLQAEGVGMLK